MQEDKDGLDILYVRLFGTASLTYAGRKIDCVSNRSKLIWNILVYLICNQGKLVRTEDLIANVWNSSNNVNPANAMRTAIFRVRQMLDELIEEGSGKFLMSQNGGYMWNPTIPTVVDCVEFDRLMTEINDHPDDYGRMFDAFYLYEGRFLSQQSSDLWVVPRQVYYHKLYESLIDRMLPVLEREKKYFDAICACRKVLLMDPFSERNYQNLMRFLLMNNEREEVIKVYKQMSKTMLTWAHCRIRKAAHFIRRRSPLLPWMLWLLMTLCRIWVRSMSPRVLTSVIMTASDRYTKLTRGRLSVRAFLPI